jgi:hypothetical protein
MNGLMIIPTPEGEVFSTEKKDWAWRDRSEDTNQQKDYHGLRAMHLRTWGWSASSYSLEHLINAKHDHNLRNATKNNEDIYIHLDSHTMGLGGVDSWTPNVPEEYLISPMSKEIDKILRINFLMIPLNNQRKAAVVYDEYKNREHGFYGIEI